MRVRIVGLILIALMGLNIFGVAKQPTVPSTASKYGWQGDLVTSFYLMEGIKNNNLYNNPEEAQKLFNLSLKSDSTHAPAYYYAAQNLFQSDAKKAIEYSAKASELSPDNIWYQTQLGQFLLMDQQYERAIPIYQNLVQEVADPGNYRLLAAIYQQTKQPFTAISILDTAEYKFGRIEELANFKRQLLLQVNMFDKALEESVKMLEEFPYDENNLLVVAELYGALKNDSLAAKYYNEAVTMNPENPNVLLSLNQFYKARKDRYNTFKTTKQIFQNQYITLEAKINLFREIVSDSHFNNYLQLSDLTSTLRLMYPNDYRTLQLNADLRIAAQKFDEALDMYKAQLNDSVNDIRIFNNILDLETYFNHPDSVAKYSELALTFFPQEPNIYIQKAFSLIYMEQIKEALKTYKEALKYAETDSLKSVIYGMIGDTKYNQSKKSSYEKDYLKALELNPDNALILNNYSYLLATDRTKEADHKRALEMSERAITLDSNNPTFLDTYAWILYKLGRYEEAKKFMQQALSLDKTNSAELLIHYGDILYELGEYFMASVYWKKALEAGYEAKAIELRFEKIQGK